MKTKPMKPMPENLVKAIADSKKAEPEYRTITIPRHPDDKDIPDSLLSIPLPSGAIAYVRAPLFSKTMDMIHDTLLICKEAIVRKPDDFEI